MSLFRKYTTAKPANLAKEEIGLANIASLAPPFPLGVQPAERLPILQEPYLGSYVTSKRPQLSNNKPSCDRHSKGLQIGWRPEPRAWIKDGELRITGVFESLAVEIVRLTVDDLALQHQLLTEHCPPSSSIKGVCSEQNYLIGRAKPE